MQDCVFFFFFFVSSGHMRVLLSQDDGSLSAEVAFWHSFNTQKQARHTFNRFFFAELLLTDVAVGDGNRN